MKTKALAAMCLAVMAEAFVAGQAAAPQRPASNTPAAPAVTQRALIDQYCVVCHNEKLKTANPLLDKVDLVRIADHRDIAEKVVRKMRAWMMPRRACRGRMETRERLIVWLEQELDNRATPHLPAPGIHRLNRTEYTNVIRDLLGRAALQGAGHKGRTAVIQMLGDHGAKLDTRDLRRRSADANATGIRH